MYMGRDRLLPRFMTQRYLMTETNEPNLWINSPCPRSREPALRYYKHEKWAYHGFAGDNRIRIFIVQILDEKYDNWESFESILIQRFRTFRMPYWLSLWLLNYTRDRKRRGSLSLLCNSRKLRKHFSADSKSICFRNFNDESSNDLHSNSKYKPVNSLYATKRIQYHILYQKNQYMHVGISKLWLLNLKSISLWVAIFIQQNRHLIASIRRNLIKKGNGSMYSWSSDQFSQYFDVL